MRMGTWFERLSSLDSLFLELEDRTTHMHVGAVAVFDGKAPPYRDFLQLIDARLHQVPRYRQRVQFVPFKQGRPVWVDETQFDLEYHVRHTALPAPGGDEELKKLAGRLFSQALDRDKPLWEMWLVEGLGDGRFAILSKTHHCMLDGISGVDLATVLMDSEPSSMPPPAPSAWTPRKAPPISQLLLQSVREQVTHPLRMVREALEPNSEAVKLFGQVFSGLKPLFEMVSMGRAPESPLNVPIGPHRRFEMIELPLAEVKDVRAALGGTVTDVIVATVAAALRSRRPGPAVASLPAREEDAAFLPAGAARRAAGGGHCAPLLRRAHRGGADRRRRRGPRSSRAGRRDQDGARRAARATGSGCRCSIAASITKSAATRAARRCC